MEIAKEKFLSDGMYAVSDDTIVYEVDSRIGDTNEDIDNDPKALKFIAKYPNFVVASAYETGTTILLSKPPKKFKHVGPGCGFNYGSTNLIENCPKRLLILAEND